MKFEIKIEIGTIVKINSTPFFLPVIITRRIPVINVKIIIQYLDFFLKGVFLKFKNLKPRLIIAIDNITRSEKKFFKGLYEENSKLISFL